MGPKRKPKDETKKTKNSKSDNQILLSQFFPNLNQNKTKVYQNILSKPNAVFKQEKKLSKDILSEENQIIKQINNLFRDIFFNANHEDINRFAQIFMKSSFERFSDIKNMKPSLCQQKMIVQEPQKQNNFDIPINQTTSQVNFDEESSIYTRTISIRKEKMIDLTDFQFRESLFKQRKSVQRVRCQRKFSQVYISPEKTLTMSRQPESKSQSQIFCQRNECINWNSFEFNSFLSSFKGQKSKNNQKLHNHQENSNKMSFSESHQIQTITIPHENSFNKDSSFNKVENDILENQQQSNEMLQAEKNHGKNQILVTQQSIKTPFKFTKKSIKDNFSALKLEPLNIDSESSIKDLSIEIYRENEEKLKYRIDRIIEQIQKKEKAKEQEMKFRNYVQQMKQKQMKLTGNFDLCNEKDLQVTQIHFSDQIQLFEENICSVKRNQSFTCSTEEFDIMDFILHKRQDLQFTFFFEDELESDQQKQVNHLIKEQSYQIDDQLSTKQQTSRSSNSISSQRFIEYVESLEPSFDLPEEFLSGYLKDVFNPTFFRRIHQLEIEKARMEANIQDKFI